MCCEGTRQHITQKEGEGRQSIFNGLHGNRDFVYTDFLPPRSSVRQSLIYILLKNVACASLMWARGPGLGSPTCHPGAFGGASGPGGTVNLRPMCL